jgi:hypothetical protein
MRVQSAEGGPLPSQNRANAFGVRQRIPAFRIPRCRSRLRPAMGWSCAGASADRAAARCGKVSEPNLRPETFVQADGGSGDYCGEDLRQVQHPGKTAFSAELSRFFMACPGKCFPKELILQPSEFEKSLIFKRDFDFLKMFTAVDWLPAGFQ